MKVSVRETLRSVLAKLLLFKVEREFNTIKKKKKVSSKVNCVVRLIQRIVFV